MTDGIIKTTGAMILIGALDTSFGISRVLVHLFKGAESSLLSICLEKTFSLLRPLLVAERVNGCECELVRGPDGQVAPFMAACATPD